MLRGQGPALVGYLAALQIGEREPVPAAALRHSTDQGGRLGYLHLVRARLHAVVLQCGLVEAPLHETFFCELMWASTRPRGPRPDFPAHIQPAGLDGALRRWTRHKRRASGTAI